MLTISGSHLDVSLSTTPSMTIIAQASPSRGPDRPDRIVIDRPMAQRLRDELLAAYPRPVLSGTHPSHVITDDVKPAPVKAPPKGAQQYRGNGNHAWEFVANVPHTERLRVPGGWLYRTAGSSLVFVPVPNAVGYAV